VGLRSTVGNARGFEPHSLRAGVFAHVPPFYPFKDFSRLRDFSLFREFFSFRDLSLFRDFSVFRDFSFSEIFLVSEIYRCSEMCVSSEFRLRPATGTGARACVNARAALLFV
jgi:hypothetical protein